MNSNDAASGKFNNLRSAIRLCGKGLSASSMLISKSLLLGRDMALVDQPDGKRSHNPLPNFPKSMPCSGSGYDMRGKNQTHAEPSTGGAILCHMKVEEIAEAIAKLPPDQLARFRRWFAAFEAGRADHAEELDSAAVKLGRFAGRTFAELKKRAKEP